MSDGQRAARLTDPICHSLGIVGLIGGALLGAAVGAFMILTLPASAPLLAAALVGAAAAGAIGGGALAGEQLMHGIQTAFGLPDPVTGMIGIVGSPNVLIGGLPAVRTVIDMAVPCNGLFSTHHFPIPSAPPAPIAEGSATVLINGQPAARVTSKIVCGAVIKDGCATVIIGGPTKRVLAVHDFQDTLHSFFADVMKVSLLAMGAITACAGAGPLLVFGLTVGAFYAANETLGMLGDQLGPGWRDILQGGFGLGAIVVGGKAAEEPRANPLNYRMETDPNALGSNFGNARLEFSPPQTSQASPKITVDATGRRYGSYNDLTDIGAKDAHHIIQDAAVRDLPGYSRGDAPAVELPGPSTKVGSPHYEATQAQRQAGGGSYAAERRIGYRALRQGGLLPSEARDAIENADKYFQGIGVNGTMPTRLPGNRR